MTLSPIRTMPQSRITRLESKRFNTQNSHQPGNAGNFGDLLEVGVEIITQGDVAAIVDVHWWLDEDSFTDLAEVLLEQLLSIRGERLRSGIIWEMVIVLVHELPCTETALRQFGCLGVVSGLILSANPLKTDHIVTSSTLRGDKVIQDTRDHLLVHIVIAPRSICQRLSICYGSRVFLRFCRHFDEKLCLMLSRQWSQRDAT